MERGREDGSRLGRRNRTRSRRGDKRQDVEIGPRRVRVGAVVQCRWWRRVGGTKELEGQRRSGQGEEAELASLYSSTATSTVQRSTADVTGRQRQGRGLMHAKSRVVGNIESPQF